MRASFSFFENIDRRKEGSQRVGVFYQQKNMPSCLRCKNTYAGDLFMGVCAMCSSLHAGTCMKCSNLVSTGEIFCTTCKPIAGQTSCRFSSVYVLPGWLTGKGEFVTYGPPVPMSRRFVPSNAHPYSSAN